MRFWRKMIAWKSLVKNHYSMFAYRTGHYTNCWLCFWLGLLKLAYLPIYSFNLVYFRTQDRGDSQKKTVQIWIETDENFTNGRISKLLVLFWPTLYMYFRLWYNPGIEIVIWNLENGFPLTQSKSHDRGGSSFLTQKI